MLLKEARELAVRHNYTEGLARIHFCTGNHYYHSNIYKEALANYDQALNLSVKSGDILLQARCIERMASVHLYTNDPNLALKLYYQALPLFESVQNNDGIASVYNILGIYKTDQNEFDTAYFYFEKAMALNRRVKNEYGLLQNRGNLAYLYEKQGKMEQAEKIYHELIEELEKKNEKMNLPVIYDNYSSLLQKSYRNNESLSNLRKGINIAEQTMDTSILGSMYQNTGQIYFTLKQLDSATAYLKKSVVCARSVGSARDEFKALSLLMAIDTISGDYKAAAAKSQRMITLKDSIYAHKIRNNLRNSELSYENAKKEKLIVYQQLQLKIARQKKTWYSILFLISTLSGILLYH